LFLIRTKRVVVFHQVAAQALDESEVNGHVQNKIWHWSVPIILQNWFRH